MGGKIILRVWCYLYAAYLIYSFAGFCGKKLNDIVGTCQAGWNSAKKEDMAPSYTINRQFCDKKPTPKAPVRGIQKKSMCYGIRSAQQVIRQDPADRDAGWPAPSDVRMCTSTPRRAALFCRSTLT